MAEKLDVPVYIHLEMLSPDILKLVSKYPGLDKAMWGFAIQTGLHGIRLIRSGIFDKYPRLKIILGHLGEAIPYWLCRIDRHTSDELKPKKKPSQYYKENFYVTTSGMFDLPPLMCCHAALGADRILFAVDYPVETSMKAIQAV